MTKALEHIKKTMTQYEAALKECREEFDRTDANHPYKQALVAQNITLICAKLDALKHLYKILGGV